MTNFDEKLEDAVKHPCDHDEMCWGVNIDQIKKLIQNEIKNIPYYKNIDAVIMVRDLREIFNFEDTPST